MELELEVWAREFGPLERAACTRGLVADGERRFVVEESGPGVICGRVGGRVRGGGGKDPQHCGRAMGEGERRSGREGATEVVV